MSTQATSDIARGADADGFPVRFELLGPFRVLHHSQPLKVGGPTAQAVLIALLQHRNERVSVQQVTDGAWGQPNRVDPDSVYHYVSDLRKALKSTGFTVTGARPDYRVEVPDNAVDTVQFDGLVRGARALRDTDPEEAIARLRQAVDLWHGPAALPGIRLAGIRRLAAGMDARRLDAEEDLAVLELDRGRANQVLDRLRDLVSHHPGRAGLFAALIRALHATGRTDEAEHRCAQVERTSRKPLHPKIVQAAAELRSGRRAPAPKRPSTVPFQLPPDTPHFTGRADDLTHLLDRWPAEDESAPSTLVVSAVEGMAGIGKTALAVHAAHRLADRFPDGVLSIDLRGFTPDTEPTPPERALDTLLRGLGVPGQNIPPDLDARVALYRTVLARRQVLILLDNAADEDQVRPLLPSTSGCLVLVTSRRRLAGLDDADHLILGVLPEPDAIALFYKVAGDRVTGADHQTIERIVRLCGCLPLAIRIAAGRLRVSQAMTATNLHGELGTEMKTAKSLGGLDDGYRNITAVLAVSYRHLTTEQQAAFQLIGLHPGTHLDPYALAALADADVAQARRLLGELERASLVNQPAYGRYTLHDLVAIYAARTARTAPEPNRQATLDRLFDHYTHTATVAMDAAYPYETDQRPHRPTPHTPTPTLDTPAAAGAWLDDELDNLLTTATHGQPDHTLHLSAALRRHLYTRAHYTDAEILHTHAQHIAHATGNPIGEQDALTGLGHAHYMQGRYEQAADCFGQALSLAQATGNRNGEQNALHGLGQVHLLQGRHGQAADCFGQVLVIAHATGNRNGEQNALYGLGHLHRVQGRHAQAAECFGQALSLAHATGNRTGEQNALTGLGHLHRMQGRHGQAADYYEQVLIIARDTGHRTGEQNALTGLGHLHRMQGRHGQAADCFGQALSLARDTGHRPGEQIALYGLGDLHRVQGRYGHAADCFGQVLALARDTGDRNYQFEAHQGLGRVHYATGQHETALTCHHTALELATDLDQPQDQSRAHDGLACAHLTLGHPEDARHHWQTALTLLTTHGLTHTDESQVTVEALRTRLAGLDGQEGGAG